MRAGIAALPSDVVHLIAAGEVIDSLAAVVRELAENALDAGATRITIALSPEHWRIRVADNGSGMALADLKQAAAPHSTSKIRSSQDLWQLTSLGFRGEALHSLAQLATLEILSRSNDAEAGWHVTYDSQGTPLQVDPVAIAPGTVVIVDHLFGTWTARRHGLPPLAQQLRAVQTIIHQLALCHPHVTWQVRQSDRDWFQLWSGKTARHILPQILRDVQPGDLQELTLTVPNLDEDIEMIDVFSPSPLDSSTLYLLLGLPDRCHRHRPDWVRVAFNGRVVQMPELEQTLLAGFRQTVPRDRFPLCFVHLQVPPEQIDWNRHPAKSEIYLHHLADWREQISNAIMQALRLSPINLTDTLYSQRTGTLLKTAEAESGYGSRRIQEVEEAGEAGGESIQNSALHSNSLKAIAQVHNTYILAEYPGGIWLIEQHIAHERVLYEQLCDRWQLVTLEPAVILPQLTIAQVEQLQRLGLEVEPFGEQVWMVRSAPALLAQREDCPAALLELSLGGDLQAAQVATACRSAIRNGTSLTQQEMQTLLNQWQQTRNPRTCPHGRPICLTLEESSLSRFFRRHWVIGKSHGI
ncbi:DNA mismatch repair endonuclease MutL [Leptolyngbya sp. FACHB-321]|uniref:DNA mismatch repair endonuclease MutL n=1 Tax=Leptolyngbya sp. FACHB-321 TaxID=2692807 RepID=UPI0016880160|nr:DNA mismatch repair endonuclease MutL [Leptolyngbya sp. FACHB-321]MBD2034214.1 DNA mismatch repair endonuclease MutL [Leptolyngbya sp. FACHB-321]